MKMDIMLGILITLLNKEFVTAKFLADKFFISTRTVYRYLTILDTCDIPIETKTGNNGGIRILNTYKLNNLFFTNEEKDFLINSLNSSESDANLKSTILDKLNLM